MIPILTFEILTGKILTTHAQIFRKSAKKTFLIYVILILISSFVAVGNGYDFTSANTALIGSIFLVSLFYLFAKKSDLTVFNFGKIGGSIVVIAMLILYGYLFNVFLPERTPATVLPYVSIVISYLILIFLIRKSEKFEPQLQLVESNQYAPGDLLKFSLVTIVGLNVFIFIPGVSAYVHALTYLAMDLVGVILFLVVVYKIFIQKSITRV
jgi:hypothetical protein